MQTVENDACIRVAWTGTRGWFQVQFLLREKMLLGKVKACLIFIFKNYF